MKKLKHLFIKAKKYLKEYKWVIHWSFFSIIIIVLIIITLFSKKTEWIKDMIQTLATISGIYITLIIFLQSKEESDEQFREQINQLQQLNQKQIDTLTLNTQKQIETIQNSTSEQVSSFEHEINIVVNKLSDNSILLGEILARELEKAIQLYNKTLEKETSKYKSLLSFKIGRTKEEREIQIKKQLQILDNIRKGFNSLVNKYQNLRNHFGNNNKLNS